MSQSVPPIPSLSSQTCLVTGGAGFIGCALSPALTARFGRVVAIDNLHPQIHATATRPAALAAGVELAVGDVTVAEDWDRLLARVRPDVIIHLAAETGTGQSLTESDRHGRVNVCGATTMLDALARAKHTPRRFVLSSSRAVYGEGGWLDGGGDITYPLNRSREMLAAETWDFEGLSYTPCSARTTWPQPCSIYGATKLAQEHLLSAWSSAFGSELSIVRLQNVYGPGQSLTNSYTGILSLFCRLAREGEAIPVYEDGAMLRDFVFIDDVAAAIMSVITSPLQPALDIGTGRATSILDAAGIVAQIYGAPPPVITGQYRFGDVRHAACDLAPTLQAIPDWRAEFTPETGLARLVQWVEAQLAAVPVAASP